MKYLPKYKLLLKLSLIGQLLLGTLTLILFAPSPGRASVRDTLLPEPNMIKLSDTLAVKTEDEDGYYTWQLAQEQCASYGKGWRVPLIMELLILYRKKDTLGGFNGEWYWSSSEFYNDYGRSHNFRSGDRNDPYEDKNRPYCVRCIKTLEK